jgi:hypothetical protein
MSQTEIFDLLKSNPLKEFKSKDMIKALGKSQGAMAICLKKFRGRVKFEKNICFKIMPGTNGGHYVYWYDPSPQEKCKEEVSA